MAQVYQRAIREVRPICPLTRGFPSGGASRGGRSVRRHGTAGAAHRGSAQLVRRRVARLDDGRVRLLPGRARLRRDRERIRCLPDPDGVPHHRDAGDAPGRGRDLRRVGRPGGAPDPAARRRELLLRRRLPCAFAPNFTVLLVLRLLYGIGMGGEWGLGAALAMEKIPPARRGFFSGVLQQGYSLGYLLASLASLVVLLRAGPVVALAVRPVIIPALISLFIRTRVRESDVWRDTREKVRMNRSRSATCCSNPAVLRRFGYLILLMTAFNWMSHGTQDLYPTFLKATDEGVAGLSSSPNIDDRHRRRLQPRRDHRRYPVRHPTRNASAAGIPIVFCGGAYFGAADRAPLRALPRRPGSLMLGSFLMQVCVQGAWGAIPAHLTEMSPGRRSVASIPASPTSLGNLPRRPRPAHPGDSRRDRTATRSRWWGRSSRCCCRGRPDPRRQGGEGHRVRRPARHRPR